jgi:hypothetical protein
MWAHVGIACSSVVSSGPMADKASKTVAANDAKAAKPRSAAEIEAEIVASRQRLVESVGQLELAVKAKTNPRHIIKVQVQHVKGFYIDDYGGVRPERVVLTVGVIVSFVTLRKIKRRVFSKSK